MCNVIIHKLLESSTSNVNTDMSILMTYVQGVTPGSRGLDIFD